MNPFTLSKKSTVILATVLLMPFFSNAQAALQFEKTTTEFDQFLERDNLPISNGILHISPYRITNGKNRYYPTDGFSQGNVEHNNQWYFKVPIKYDLFSDLIIYKTLDSETISIELTQESVQSFSINNKKFLYLTGGLNLNSVIKNGYYEENYKGKHFTFYIKHKRTKRDVLKNQSVMHEFDDYYSYYLFADSIFHRIQTKKDLIRLYPNVKSKINDFYIMNRSLEKNDKTAFYELLAPYLDTALTQSATNK